MGTIAATGEYLKPNRAKVALLTLAGAVLVGAAFYDPRPNPVDRLQPFIGKDLRMLSEEERAEFDDIISALLPQANEVIRPKMPRSLNLREWLDYFAAKPVRFRFFSNWYLWKTVNGQGKIRLI